MMGDNGPDSKSGLLYRNTCSMGGYLESMASKKTTKKTTQGTQDQ